jgi:Dihydro-orotase-like
MGNKILLSFSLILSAFSLTAQTTVATQTSDSFQSTKAWTWSNYKIAFQAATDLAVRENSSTVFYAGNGKIFLNIYPKKEGAIAYDKMPQALQKWASDSKVSFDSSSAGYLSNVNQLWAYYINGTDYKGMPVYLSLLIDSAHPENNYYVWMQYNSGSATTALAILNSFRAQ